MRHFTPHETFPGIAVLISGPEFNRQMEVASRQMCFTVTSVHISILIYRRTFCAALRHVKWGKKCLFGLARLGSRSAPLEKPVSPYGSHLLIFPRPSRLLQIGLQWKSRQHHTRLLLWCHYYWQRYLPPLSALPPHLRLTTEKLQHHVLHSLSTLQPVIEELNKNHVCISPDWEL